jgi:hypothetical protein
MSCCLDHIKSMELHSSACEATGACSSTRARSFALSPPSAPPNSSSSSPPQGKTTCGSQNVHLLALDGFPLLLWRNAASGAMDARLGTWMSQGQG